MSRAGEMYMHYKNWAKHLPLEEPKYHVTMIVLSISRDSGITYWWSDGLATMRTWVRILIIVGFRCEYELPTSILAQSKTNPHCALACSRPKFVKSFRSPAREHTVTVIKRSWVQDGVRSYQNCPYQLWLTVRAEQSFAIRSNHASLLPVTLTFALTTTLWPTLGFGILLACFRSLAAIQSEICFFESCFSVALWDSLADFVTEICFGREKTEYANAPTMKWGIETDPIVVLHAKP